MVWRIFMFVLFFSYSFLTKDNLTFFLWNLHFLTETCKFVSENSESVVWFVRQDREGMYVFIFKTSFSIWTLTSQSFSLSSKSKLNSVKWRKIKNLTWTRPIHRFGIRIHVSFMPEAKRSDFKKWFIGKNCKGCVTQCKCCANSDAYISVFAQRRKEPSRFSVLPFTFHYLMCHFTHFYVVC